jgi:hypothetical protein
MSISSICKSSKFSDLFVFPPYDFVSAAYSLSAGLKEVLTGLKEGPYPDFSSEYPPADLKTPPPNESFGPVFAFTGVIELNLPRFSLLGEKPPSFFFGDVLLLYSLDFIIDMS